MKTGKAKLFKEILFAETPETGELVGTADLVSWTCGRSLYYCPTYTVMVWFYLASLVYQT